AHRERERGVAYTSWTSPRGLSTVSPSGRTNRIRVPGATTTSRTTPRTAIGVTSTVALTGYTCPQTVTAVTSSSTMSASAWLLLVAGPRSAILTPTGHPAGITTQRCAFLTSALTVAVSGAPG